jgi:hypothetical protein
VVTGRVAGSPSEVSGGRVSVELREAVIEAPGDLLAWSEGEEVQLELVTKGGE